MHTKSNIIHWLGIAGRSLLTIYLAFIVMILPVFVAFKLIKPHHDTEIKQTVDYDGLEKKLADMEKQLEKQTVLIKKLESEHDALVTANRQTERRVQNHMEAIKRLCEYVVVITVDRKIIPRQCLPEYNWRKEEN